MKLAVRGHLFIGGSAPFYVAAYRGSAPFHVPAPIRRVSNPQDTQSVTVSNATVARNGSMGSVPSSAR